MIERRSNLSGEEFRRDYLQPKRPVIISDMIDNWAARTRWTAHYLSAICGHLEVEVMGERESDPIFEINANSHRMKMNFSDFINHAFSMEPSNNTYMVANNQFMGSDGGKVLFNDIVQNPKYLDEHDQSGRVFLWLGPSGTITPLHYDMCDILLCQVYGTKKVRTFLEDQKPFLYNNTGVFSDVDPEKPDHTKFPLYHQAQQEVFYLNTGDTLFIPQGYWHQVRSLSTSISVSFTNLIR